MSGNSVAQAGFRTYIGLRYVPVIKGVWDNTQEYEALSIVVYEGNSYTSKIPVPVGVNLDNTNYWVMTGNYNVQVANLQNEVEVAVRQILDYATDFETFKQQMMALYDNFVVDADKEVEEKVIEYERLLGEQYEAFIRYVNNTLQEFRNEMDTFTDETNQRIEQFMSDTTGQIEEDFSRFETVITRTVSEYQQENNSKFTDLQEQIDGLVLNAGNPEAVSAEIASAREPYTTLRLKLNAMTSNSLAYKEITGGAFIDLNNWTNIGVYYSADSVDLINTPFGDNIPNDGFTLIVYGNRMQSSSQNVIRQILTIKYNGVVRTFERYKYTVGGVTNTFTTWKENLTTENGMIYSIGEHEYDDEPYQYNFNTLTPNTCYYMDGYISGYKPINSPDELVEGEPYSIMTFGGRYESADYRYQLLFTGSNNRVYFRHRIIGWTSWDYLTTSDDVDSVVATINGQISSIISNVNRKLTKNVLNNFEPITSISDLNNIEMSDQSVNICILGSGILPNVTAPTTLCYIWNTNTTATDIKQTIMSLSGKLYYRSYNGSAWSNISESYDTSAYRIYTDLSGSGVSLSGFNSNAVLSTSYFTEKILVVKFDSDFTGDTVPNPDDQLCYVNTTVVGDDIYQVFTTFTGRTFNQKYYHTTQTWSNLVSPYYTKAEIDAMIH